MPVFKIQLFGALKHRLSTNIIEVEAEKSEVSCIGLTNAINKQYPTLANTTTFKIAKNGELLSADNELITFKDELALLPPYAGG